MSLIDRPHTLLLRYGHDPAYLDPDSGVIGTRYEIEDTHQIIGILADICNGIGAQLRFGYQDRHYGAVGHYVSVFCKEHPDWIAAFINKMMVHPELHIRTSSIMLSNFAIKTVHYEATDHGLSWEENPVYKIGYRIVFHSLTTQGFLADDGEEIIDINDYVEASDAMAGEL